MNRMVVVVLDSAGKAYAGLRPWRALLAAPWRAS